jgi:PAS domain S-box-containing protein
VVFTLDGLVTYLNPAFTEIFGWTLEELKGKSIPYVPPGMERETLEGIVRLLREKRVLRHETKRLTKDGKIRDVILRATLYMDAKDRPAGELVILRDITREKRVAMNNEAMLRISLALPSYPGLDERLDYVCSEVIQLLNTEGAIVTLLEEDSQEFLFLGAAYDNADTQNRVKGMRFSMDHLEQFVVPKGLRTGEPIVVNDTSRIAKSYPFRDEKLGYATRNFLQVTLRSRDRIIGTLCAMNKKEGLFHQADKELLSTVAGTVALSIENARSAEQLKAAYAELTTLDRAKDKVFHHLSHELKTPVSVLSGSLRILSKRLAYLPKETWRPTVERAQRNVDRIMEIQAKTEDIVLERHDKTHDLLSRILDQCSDELQTLFAEEVGESPLIQRVRDRVDDLFGPKGIVAEEIDLPTYANQRLKDLKPLFDHRRVEIITCLEPTGPIQIPREPLEKVFDGLLKNAVENTPDEGKTEVRVGKRGEGSELTVRDWGVGITEGNQQRIFEGFFTTRETMAYASKSPFDFNAGGKGMDLLRMRIFSERYKFMINMESSRCRFIPEDSDICPGRISLCGFCSKREDCHASGGTTFVLYFPPALELQKKGS